MFRSLANSGFPVIKMEKKLKIIPVCLSHIVSKNQPCTDTLYQRYIGVVNTLANGESADVSEEESGLFAKDTGPGAEDEI